MDSMTETDSDVIDAINDLIQMEYDAAAGYEAAINRLESREYKEKLTEFLSDHRRHIAEETTLVTQLGGKPKHGGDMKMVMTKGKVLLADLWGNDKAILMAMKSNEEDTNAVYEKMSARNDMGEVAKNVMLRGLADERRHKAWIEAVLGHMNDKKLAS